MVDGVDEWVDGTVDGLGEALLPVLVAVLLLAAIGKAASRPEIQSGSPGGPVSTSSRGAVYLLAGIEAALAGALLFADGWLATAVGLAVGVYFCGAVLALLTRRARDPVAGCGCFGSLSSHPIGVRVVGRTLLLAVAAIATAAAGTSGMAAIREMTAQQWTIAGGALLTLALFSPEVSEVARRLTGWDPCTVRDVPPARTLARLRTSDVWRANATFVADAPPQEIWRYGCWRMFRFRGKREGKDTDLVFAVSLRRRSTAVHAVFADPETGATLAAFGEVSPKQRRRTRTRLPVPDSTERTVRLLEAATPVPHTTISTGQRPPVAPRPGPHLAQSPAETGQPRY